MTSRKKQNMEIERKKKALRLRHTVSLLGFVLIIVAAIAWVMWDNHSRSWIMTFEGQRIQTSDAQFWVDTFSMFGGDENLVENAMNELVDSLILLSRGNTHGVGLSEEEHLEMADSMAGQLGWMGINYISPMRAGELMAAGNIASRLMDIYVPTYTPNPQDFEEAFAEYILTNGENYANYEVKFVVTDTFEDAFHVWELVPNTDNFDDLIREYSVFYEEEFGIHTLDARMLVDDLMLFGDDPEIVLGLQNGESHIVQFEDQFLVIYMYDRSEADPAVMEASFTANFTHNRRMEEFRVIRDQWRADANISINQRAYATL